MWAGSLANYSDASAKKHHETVNRGDLATSRGGAGYFLLAGASPWTAGQMWIGDVAGGARAYGAEIVSESPVEAWLIGQRDGQMIGFQLRLLAVAPDLPLWRVGNLVLPQPCP